ncbi:hypothetical protein GCM10022419_115320 [Nonomuraea rosea]|uniref:Uncharacterized protein n=1 Tax=Nonomuraea rosea TaxID=638574 RepID=A0ABP6ZJ23_9ACTN
MSGTIHVPNTASTRLGLASQRMSNVKRGNAATITTSRHPMTVLLTRTCAVLYETALATAGASPVPGEGPGGRTHPRWVMCGQPGYVSLLVYFVAGRTKRRCDVRAGFRKP